MSLGMLMWQTAFALRLLAIGLGTYYAGDYSLWLAPVALVVTYHVFNALQIAANTLISDFWFGGDEDAFEQRMEELYREFWGVTDRR